MTLPWPVPMDIRRFWKHINQPVERVAQWLTSDGFLTVDKFAIWFYLVCFGCFLLAVAADLNGSSSGIYPVTLGQGVPEHSYLGEPRNIRSDEWGYATPDVLSQALRSDRFAVKTSNLGSHSVALTGNIPVRHFSELFRPQFWGFFVLPVDYAYSLFWQAKALLLVSGVFTWLLLLTRSSVWAATGALWFFFSPFTQWCYSWPSALPEMIGSGCVATVCFCYLSIGRRLIPLAVAGVGALLCTMIFVLCSYLPHLIPLALLHAFIFGGWLVANRRRIASREALPLRLAVSALLLLVLAIVGAALYSDLHVAIEVIGNTVYPGRRIVAGGSWPAWVLASQFLPWGTSEYHFPPALLNICEGSGFLWLAPLPCFVSRHRNYSRISAWRS